MSDVSLSELASPDARICWYEHSPCDEDTSSSPAEAFPGPLPSVSPSAGDSTTSPRDERAAFSPPVALPGPSPSVSLAAGDSTDKARPAPAALTGGSLLSVFSQSAASRPPSRSTIEEYGEHGSLMNDDTLVYFMHAIGRIAARRNLPGATVWAPRDFLRVLGGGAPPSTTRRLAVAGFDGPHNRGHFFYMSKEADSPTLIARDCAPEDEGPRECARNFAHKCGLSVEATPVDISSNGDCGSQTLAAHAQFMGLDDAHEALKHRHSAVKWMLATAYEPAAPTRTEEKPVRVTSPAKRQPQPWDNKGRQDLAGGARRRESPRRFTPPQHVAVEHKERLAPPFPSPRLPSLPSIGVPRTPQWPQLAPNMPWQFLPCAALSAASGIPVPVLIPTLSLLCDMRAASAGLPAHADTEASPNSLVGGSKTSRRCAQARQRLSRPSGAAGNDDIIRNAAALSFKEIREALKKAKPGTDVFLTLRVRTVDDAIASGGAPACPRCHSKLDKRGECAYAACDNFKVHCDNSDYVCSEYTGTISTVQDSPTNPAEKSYTIDCSTGANIRGPNGLTWAPKFDLPPPAASGVEVLHIRPLSASGKGTVKSPTTAPSASPHGSALPERDPPRVLLPQLASAVPLASSDAVPPASGDAVLPASSDAVPPASSGAVPHVFSDPVTAASGDAVPLASSDAVPPASSDAVPLASSDAVTAASSDAVPHVSSNAVPLASSDAVEDTAPETPSPVLPPRRASNGNQAPGVSPSQTHGAPRPRQAAAASSAKADDDSSDDDAGELDFDPVEPPTADTKARLYTGYAPISNAVPPEIDPRLHLGDTASGNVLAAKTFAETHLYTFKEAQFAAPQVVWAAVQDNTRKGHIRELRAFQEYVVARPSHHHLPLDFMAADFIQRRRAAKNHKWSTAESYAGSLLSALSLLWLYSADGPHLQPCRRLIFDGAMTAIKRQAKKQGYDRALPATSADIEQATEALDGNPKLQVSLLLAWYTAARVGNVFSLARRDFIFGEDRNLTVTFTEHKTQDTIGPFTIHTRTDSERDFAMIKDFVSELPDEWRTIAPTYSEAQKDALVSRITAALRTVNKKLECYSVRRGSIQRLADMDLSPDEIVEFSKHSGLKGLKSYLDNEKIAHGKQRDARRKLTAAQNKAEEAKKQSLAAKVRQEVPLRGAGPLRHDHGEGQQAVDTWCSVTRSGGITFSDNVGVHADPGKIDRSNYIFAREGGHT